MHCNEQSDRIVEDGSHRYTSVNHERYWCEIQPALEPENLSCYGVTDQIHAREIACSACMTACTQFNVTHNSETNCRGQSELHSSPQVAGFPADYCSSAEQMSPETQDSVSLQLTFKLVTFVLPACPILRFLSIMNIKYS
jgi:hypothetical protein